jgi:hypothetical protein
MTHLGFTSSREQPNTWQQNTIAELLLWHRGMGFTHFHHGDCVGGDFFGAHMAYRFGYVVVCHPPINPSLRGYAPYHEIWEPKPYALRNTDVVAQSHAGIGAPNTEPQASHASSRGTWSTIEKFNRAGCPHWIVSPTKLWARVPGLDLIPVPGAELAGPATTSPLRAP